MCDLPVNTCLNNWQNNFNPRVHLLTCCGAIDPITLSSSADWVCSEVTWHETVDGDVQTFDVSWFWIDKTRSKAVDITVGSVLCISVF